MNTMTLELPFDLVAESVARPASRSAARADSYPDSYPDSYEAMRPGRQGGHGVVQRLFTDVLSAEPYAVGSRRASSTVDPATYRRRRFLVMVILGLVISAATLLGGELIGRVTGTYGASLVEASGEPVVYVVQPGDTLWSIAGRVNPPGRDLRHTVDRLSEVTGGSLLHPGQRIVIPYG